MDRLTMLIHNLRLDNIPHAPRTENLRREIFPPEKAFLNKTHGECKLPASMSELWYVIIRRPSAVAWSIGGRLSSQLRHHHATFNLAYCMKPILGPPPTVIACFPLSSYPWGSRNRAN